MRALIVLIALMALTQPAVAHHCASVESGEAELVRFASENARGEPVTVEALLMKPEGEGPFPAVLMLHTAAGIEPPGCYAAEQRLLREQGYLSLAVDSMSGLAPDGAQRLGISVYDVLRDARHAGDWLAASRDVDARRMALIGWSRGALATLLALASPRAYAPAEPMPFAAGIAFYPTCPRVLEKPRAPIQILHGEADAVAPISSCRAVEHLGVALIAYPDARHRFDLGATADAIATADSRRRLLAFLAEHLR